jgi:hypothetical protein
MGARHVERVCDNHQASGVATINKMMVVNAASLSVKAIACHASGLIAPIIA